MITRLYDHQFRASSVGKMMAYPDKNSLPDGALTYINEIASQIILNWKPQLDLNALSKGLQCESESIALYNDVVGTSYAKNETRITSDILTGECDILDRDANLVIDIKTSYSKKTHPITIKDGDRKLYEWQLTAYMHLFQVDHAELAYVLVDTPDDLISKREPRDWHKVGDIPQKFRVTRFEFEKSDEKIQQLLSRCFLAQEKLKEILDSKGYDFSTKHESNDDNEVNELF
jgi:hypothetical protein